MLENTTKTPLTYGHLPENSPAPHPSGATGELQLISLKDVKHLKTVFGFDFVAQIPCSQFCQFVRFFFYIVF